jgi:hypothetical protein
MGYRLYCRNSGDRQSEICFGKLVGYTNDIELKSLQYLLKIRKISKEDYETPMNWHDPRSITLTDLEFLKFMHYYIYDWIYACDGYSLSIIHDPIVKLVLSDLLTKPCNKIIEWR